MISKLVSTYSWLYNITVISQAFIVAYLRMTLEIVLEALDGQWSGYEQKLKGSTDLGVFFDWSSLYQEPRSDEEREIFKEALKGINLWYGHLLTTVWLITAGKDEVEGW